MKKKLFFTLLLVGLLPFAAFADTDPQATYTNSKGETFTVWDKIEGEAPLTIRFTANPSMLEDGVTLEWHFNHTGVNGNSDVTRYEEDTEFVFTESGTTVVSLVEKQGDEEINRKSISVIISESHLEMPNAFSPNDDGYNDKYGAKGVNDEGAEGHYKSIVEFRAMIFNRWGQKLYEWNDVSGYWDGTYKGSPVKAGVYYVVVKARGADGKEYDIKRDVNLIRQKNEAYENSSSSSSDQ
jgi:gliding motility-associated-like protein